MTTFNFNNTEKAFAHKTNYELVRDYQVFRLINQKWLVNFGTKTASKLLNAGIKSPVAFGMKPTVYAVFCGGESLEIATKKINSLYSYGVKSVLDFGVEGKETDEDFEQTFDAIKQAIFFAKNYDAVEIVSSKFTGLIPVSILEKLHERKALSQKESSIYEQSKSKIYKLAQLAYENNVSLFVDAEESWIQQPLDDLTLDLMRLYNKNRPIIYNTIQLYRKDRLQFFNDSIKLAEKEGFIYAAKLVRGAYMEKESVRAQKLNYENPIQLSKDDTDDDYNKALKMAIENIKKVSICIATHNEESTQLATKLMMENKLQVNHPHIHFSQLFGMSDHISFNLASAGYNASKYMPYGPVKDVIPYLIRRAEENTSVSGQMGRELKLLKEEVRRRKLFVI